MANVKHQSDAYRIIRGQKFVNYCDVLDDEHEDIVRKAKSRKVPHRLVQCDGFRRLFVLESRTGELEDSVSVVAVGNIFTASTHDGSKTFTVAAKCETNDGHWYCLTHDEGFANQLQKDLHIGEGTHVLAWNCRQHGPEVP